MQSGTVTRSTPTGTLHHHTRTTPRQLDIQRVLLRYRHLGVTNDQLAEVLTAIDKPVDLDDLRAALDQYIPLATLFTEAADPEPITKAIDPRPLTAASLPAEGELIGYTGRAYYGDEFSDRGYISGAIRIDQWLLESRYGAGFYATVVDAMAPEPYEVYIVLGDDGRQVLHGYQARADALAA